MSTDDKTHRHPFDKLMTDETRSHVKAAREEMRRSMESLLPPGFLEHRRAARRHMLLAARGLLDTAIQRLDAREHPTETKA
jgi:hypothetical protein